MREGTLESEQGARLSVMNEKRCQALQHRITSSTLCTIHDHLPLACTKHAQEAEMKKSDNGVTVGIAMVQRDRVHD